ncbi:MAG: hypothetical protein KA447_15810 [Pyrinomonadaceae bacterium]|nr:hypothetical protein [Pyrinomonadaceae bacterium]
MVTAGPPSIVITDRISDKELGRSIAIGSTDNRWTEAEVDFTATETPAVMISFLRTTCGSEWCPIFGDLALDKFMLTER